MKPKRQKCKKCGERWAQPYRVQHQPKSAWCSHCCNNRNQGNRLIRWNGGERQFCKQHIGRIVSRSTWIATGKHLCKSCATRRGSPCRVKRWEQGERPVCRIHPDRIVLRSRWVITGQRRCSTCQRYRSDGMLRPSHIQAKEKYRRSEHGREQRRWYLRSYRRAMSIQENKF